MKVFNSSLTHELTNPLMEMKDESVDTVDIMDKLMEVPFLFFCILALLSFAIIGFVLHICWKAEASRVQEWFCNGTSRQHRWRALDTLHRECLHEELFQKPAAKMKGEANKKKVAGAETVLVELDEPYAISSYGTITQIDHV